MTNFDKDLFTDWGKAMVSVTVALGMLMLACLMCGCKSQKTQTPPIQTITNTKIVHTERIDTVYVNLPQQSAERVANDSNSHLETDLAKSDAWINPDGSLGHSLTNKDAEIAVPVKNTADTVYVDKERKVPYPVTEIKEVEKQLAWWQTALMWLGGGFLALGGIWLYGRLTKVRG